ncbi:MAG TPA: non-homologous end-joining DNA ligase [Actinophytocola sp.]|jgi:DNA ligase D-like protein (predicted ligase)|uniref:non-homologous end-joining DNA ligase n=1 Tax=Actinophytocola sp. TaxID=1872138 RepID=UPI002F940571
MNGWLPPMLATPTHHRFSDEHWVFERKLDGLRVLSVRDGRHPELWSTDRGRLDDRFPELVTALAELGRTRFVADGEVVAFEGRATSRRRLRARLDRPGGRPPPVPVFYYLFDLLSLDGTRLTGQPLRERKCLLRNAFHFHDPLRYSDHWAHHGEVYFRHAREQGWDGVIAKRADSVYKPGLSTDWLSFDCVRDQDFVVGGFTAPQGSRVGFGALLIGYHEGDRLRYAGKVGTGYDRAMLRALRARMDDIRQPRCPFADEVTEPAVQWVRPELVVRVGFAEWTRAGRLRHPRFAGVRTDKTATEVVRETR